MLTGLSIIFTFYLILALLALVGKAWSALIRAPWPHSVSEE